jgi:hypothetical protein
MRHEQGQRPRGLRLDPDEPPLLAQLAGRGVELEEAEPVNHGASYFTTSRR